MKLKSLIVIVVLIGVGLWYFNFFDKPEHTINKFGDSVNSLDLEGILETLDPAQTKMARAVTGVLGTVSKAIAGVDVVDTILPLLPFMVDYVRDNDGGTMPYLRFEYISTEMNLLRTEATVKAYLIDDTTNQREESTFHLKKIDRKWRIMNIKDVM